MFAAERDDTSKRFPVVVGVKPQISLAQASRLLDRGRLGNEKTCAGRRKMTKVHGVPVGGAGGSPRCIGHWRDDYTIDLFQVSHPEMRK
jgi:hypothetical protein